MSIATFETFNHRPSRLRPILDWLRHARVALSIPPHKNLEGLTDSDLAELGARKTDIAGGLDREVRHLVLLDLGWHQPQTPKRRR